MVGILIVDELEVARQGISAFISQANEIEIIGFAQDGLEAFEFIQNCLVKPDIVLIDLFLPKIGGIKLIEEICRRFPKIKVVIITDLKNKDVALCAIKTGAFGYLLKDKLDDRILTNAIWSAHYGYVQLDAEIFNSSAKFVESTNNHVVNDCTSNNTVIEKSEKIEKVEEVEELKEVEEDLTKSLW